MEWNTTLRSWEMEMEMRFEQFGTREHMRIWILSTHHLCDWKTSVLGGPGQFNVIKLLLVQLCSRRYGFFLRLCDLFPRRFLFCIKHVSGA